VSSTKYRDPRPPGSPPEFEPPTVVTRVKGRRPEWKAHTGKAQAHSAVAFHGYRNSDVEVWEFTDGTWRQTK
jgi:hypothetical protein